MGGRRPQLCYYNMDLVMLFNLCMFIDVNDIILYLYQEDWFQSFSNVYLCYVPCTSLVIHAAPYHSDRVRQCLFMETNGTLTVAEEEPKGIKQITYFTKCR